MGSSANKPFPILEILARLRDEDWIVRRDAVRDVAKLAQGDIPGKDIDALAAALDTLSRDAKWEVRIAVALALQHLKHKSFDATISHLLEDSHFDVKRAAERTLRKRKRIARLGQWDELDALSTKGYEEIIGKHLPPAAAAEVARLSNRWLELVIGAAVHELRRVMTPLKLRITKAEHNLTPRGLPAAREHLQKARERSDFLVRVLESMEDWVGESKQPLECRKEQLARMIHDALGLVSEGFEVRSPRPVVKTTLDIPDDLWLDAPSARLILAFRNIIQNSFEAIDRRGKLHIWARRLDDQVRIAFTDTGCGMSPDARASALRPFMSTKGSTGLGLAIAYKVIHGQCGGEIEFPEVKRGTVVDVILPISHNQQAAE